ncbi:MAG: hypothetical protein ACRDTG_29180 [Pseudonocardiaceae bacterium]
MASTSTIGLARAALVTALDTGELTGKVHYAWPGPKAAKQAYELLWIDRIPQWSQAIPNIKAGRKQRQETYTFELVLWVAKPELTAAGARQTFDRAVELLTVVENALAEDVQLGQSAIQWMLLADREVDLVPYETGWGVQIMPRIQGNARLT